MPLFDAYFEKSNFFWRMCAKKSRDYESTCQNDAIENEFEEKCF